MKDTFSHVTRAATLAVSMIAAGQLQARLMPNLSVTVPFDFIVSGKSLPAGTYNILSTNSISGAPTFLVRNAAGKNQAFSVMSGRSWPSKAGNSSQVIFACRAESCYLKGLKFDANEGYFAPLPKMSPAQQERQVALDARFTPAGK
jgi:hypothetical protein